MDKTTSLSIRVPQGTSTQLLLDGESFVKSFATASQRGGVRQAADLVETLYGMPTTISGLAEHQQRVPRLHLPAPSSRAITPSSNSMNGYGNARQRQRTASEPPSPPHPFPTDYWSDTAAQASVRFAMSGLVVPPISESAGARGADRAQMLPVCLGDWGDWCHGVLEPLKCRPPPST
ncbi:transcription factor COE3 isoform X1 [Lates japonicus]|uniref:Transcription factor COE3 isoform X1 n=1 Tax=Lates japonicus TaxID=270547 RepID=A0AAD3NNP4_LATJO|nr:transcription factor COE3 isoform X1 [Lates japonicus]